MDVISSMLQIVIHQVSSQLVIVVKF